MVSCQAVLIVFDSRQDSQEECRPPSSSSVISMRIFKDIHSSTHSLVHTFLITRFHLYMIYYPCFNLLTQTFPHAYINTHPHTHSFFAPPPFNVIRIHNTYHSLPYIKKFSHNPHIHLLKYHKSPSHSSLPHKSPPQFPSSPMRRREPSPLSLTITTTTNHTHISSPYHFHIHYVGKTRNSTK